MSDDLLLDSSLLWHGQVEHLKNFDTILWGVPVIVVVEVAVDLSDLVTYLQYFGNPLLEFLAAVMVIVPRA